LHARVFARDGTRPVGLRVSAWRTQPDGSATDSRHVETDAGGDARFEALPAGLWHLRADPGAWEEVEIAVGETAEAVLQLRAEPRVFGQVREWGSGRAVSNASVVSFRRSSRDGETLRYTIGGRAAADEDGRYEIIGKSPLTGALMASLPGGGASERVDLVVGWDEVRQLDLWLPSGAVRGRIVDVASGEGVAGAWVQAARVGVDWTPGSGPSRQATGIDGAFELRGLAAGAHSLTWGAEDYARGEGVEVTLTEGEVRQGLELPLGRGGSLRVRVTTRSGAPARNGTEVTALQGDTGRYLAHGKTLEGAVTLATLPAGELEIVVGDFITASFLDDDSLILARQPVTIADGEERTLDIVVEG
jgi:hypothetical protein